MLGQNNENSTSERASANGNMTKDTPKPKVKQTSITSFFTPKGGVKPEKPVAASSTSKTVVKKPSPVVEKRPEPESDSVKEEPSVKRRKLVQRLDSDDDVEMFESDSVATLSQNAQTTMCSDTKKTPIPSKLVAISTPTTKPVAANTPTTSKTLTSPASSLKPSTPAVTTLKAKPVSRLSGFAASPSSQASTPGSGKKEKDETRYAWLENPRDAQLRTANDPEYDPRTLFIPDSAWKKFTDFERQYWEIKAKFWNTIVFFKKGKFYELYEKDAYLAHQELDLKIAERVNMSMAGVPEAGVDEWTAKLLGRGYRVAKVDQMETAVGKRMEEKAGKVKKGAIMKRELSYVLTNGTLVDPSLINSDMSTYCLALREEVQDGKPVIGFVLLDASTGEFTVSQFVDDDALTRLETMLARTKPREILYPKGEMRADTLRVIRNAVGTAGVGGVDYQSLMPDLEFWSAAKTIASLQEAEYFEEWPSTLQQAKDKDETLLLSSLGAMMWYLRTLKLDQNLFSQCNFTRYDPTMADRSNLALDAQTLRNLDILENSFDGSTTDSLLAIMNRCTTSFGKRLFKRWLCHPLGSVADINDRLDAVDDLCDLLGVVGELDTMLHRLPDLERTVSRVHSGACKPKDFCHALNSFHSIGKMWQELEPYMEKMKSRKLLSVLNSLPEDYGRMLDSICNAFDLERAEKQNVIVPNEEVDLEYATCVTKVRDAQAKLQEYLRQIRKELKSETVNYRDIGKDKFQLEMPLKLKPLSGWELKSKTANVHRYHTRELVTMIEQLEEAQELELQAQATAKSRLYAKFDERYQDWTNVVKSVAELDCLLALSKLRVSLGEPACRPTFVPRADQAVFDVKQLRHPLHVVMGMGDSFIPNDTAMGGKDPAMILLTGPNMGGKSTLLRQVGTCAIMAQMGSYVPAESLRMTPFDRIFTRIGAHDNILAGQSTFMIELAETAKILNEATPNSLVILDELGRGTSTFDGYSIAYSVLHDLITRVGCLGLFTTHHTMLTQEFAKDPAVRRVFMAFESNDDKREVTFLYKLKDGISPKSYGMNVASMAGIPHEIVDMAEQVSKEFEKEQRRATEALQSALGSSVTSMRLADFVRLFQDLSMDGEASVRQAKLIHRNLLTA